MYEINFVIVDQCCCKKKSDKRMDKERISHELPFLHVFYFLLQHFSVKNIDDIFITTHKLQENYAKYDIPISYYLNQHKLR